MKTRWILAGILIGACSSWAVLAKNGENFDRLSAADRQVFEERFTKEIWPALQRGDKNSCLGCHGPSGRGGGSLKMSGDPAKAFRALLKEGFFLPDDSGSVLERVSTKNKKQQMPPPGKGERWTSEEVQRLQQFVADLDKKQQKK